MINRDLKAGTRRIISGARRMYSGAAGGVCKRIRAEIGALLSSAHRRRRAAGGTGVCGRLREMRVVHGRRNGVQLVEGKIVFGAEWRTAAAGPAQVRGD
jgi:hypothetical protein